MIRNQCSGTLQKVTMEGVDIGLLMHDATATLTDVTITGSAVKAAEIKGGATLTASGSSFSRTGPSPGVGVFSGLVAHDKRTSAVLESCTFSDNHESAVTIFGGAVVMVSACRAERNKGVNSRERNAGAKPCAAFNIVGSGRMTVKDTAIVGDAAACGGGKIEMSGVTQNGENVTK